MSDIEVREAGAGQFEVTIVSEGQQSSHQVTVPDGYLDELGLSGADRDAVVRASIEFLLEREPPSSIMASFDLPTIARFFPEYPEELPSRLS